MKSAATPLAIAALRRFVVASQGFAGRFRRADAGAVEALVGRLSCVQLDSIATVERSHLLVLQSRAGAVDPKSVSSLLAGGRLFEYWAHEASLVPIADYPLFRRRMRERRSHHWWGPVIDGDPALARRVLDEIRERGPLGSRHFEGRGGGGMWRLKPAKRMLDALWTAGELVVAGRQGFQRLYELPERILPEAVRLAKPPSVGELLRGLARRAVAARGALTARGIIEHYRLGGTVGALGPHLARLEREGLLVRREVEDGGPPVYLPAQASIEVAPPTTSVLLSPFDNLLWDRAFVRRLFAFDHLIEVYKRPAERRWGYYVLPLLVGDRLVGRADLKADRAAGVLRVRAFHVEEGGRRTSALDEAFGRALGRLARSLDLAVGE